MNNTLVLTLTLAALPALYYVTLGRTHEAEIARLQARIAQLYDQEQPVRQQAERVRVLTATAAELETWHEELRQQLTLDPGAAPLLLRASRALQRFHIETERAELVPDSRCPPLASQAIKFTVSGGFLDLFRFIRDVESATPPCRVVELDVTPATPLGRTRAQLSLVGVWRTDA